MQDAQADWLPHSITRFNTQYANTLAKKVATPDGETDWFDTTAGVLQGDTLAPFLFIIVLDYALGRTIDGRETDLRFTVTPRRSKRQPAVTETDLDFADDIALMSDLVEQAQVLLHLVEAECLKVWLRLNTKKTECSIYNTPEHIPLKTLKGRELNGVP
ncbi:uncharacterized protein LOC119745105 [Patiria miniata]|uniref:Reverse transcriptase domain-containing protein n=1 Tax=Patiria miniata TaxID=46514 RepID=A0A914BMT3_PATMI|nr:uncharacterized protein LOC119745105 [Patiria miniata]